MPHDLREFRFIEMLPPYGRFSKQDFPSLRFRENLRNIGFRHEAFADQIRSDAVSIHLVLSTRTRGLIGASDMARMKPGAILINTSRGPIVDELALLDAVESRRIVAALDVYDREPLPPDHPLRTAPNTVLTPHLGYGVRENWKEFYQQSIENALAFLDGKPVRVTNPEAT